MNTFKQRSLRLAVTGMLSILAACATSNYALRPPELVVEGDESNYPAFEDAAKACAYTAFSAQQFKA
jgi:hypothetical protein